MRAYGSAYGGGNWVTGFEFFVRAVAIALFVGLGGIIAGGLCAFTLFDMRSAPLLQPARTAVAPQAVNPQAFNQQAFNAQAYIAANDAPARASDTHVSDARLAAATLDRTAPNKRASGKTSAPSGIAHNIAIGTVRQEPPPGGDTLALNTRGADDGLAAERAQPQPQADPQPAADDSATDDQSPKQDTTGSKKPRRVAHRSHQRYIWGRSGMGFYGGGGWRGGW